MVLTFVGRIRKCPIASEGAASIIFRKPRRPSLNTLRAFSPFLLHVWKLFKMLFRHCRLTSGRREVRGLLGVEVIGSVMFAKSQFTEETRSRCFGALSSGSDEKLLQSSISAETRSTTRINQQCFATSSLRI
jgi:hypothetical protein